MTGYCSKCYETACVCSIDPRDELIKKLVGAARVCADDLEAEVESKYNGTKMTFPSEARRYERDIAPVRMLRQALAEAKQLGYGV